MDPVVFSFSDMDTLSLMLNTMRIFSLATLDHKFRAVPCGFSLSRHSTIHTQLRSFVSTWQLDANHATCSQPARHHAICHLQFFHTRYSLSSQPNLDSPHTATSTHSTHSLPHQSNFARTGDFNRLRTHSLRIQRTFFNAVNLLKSGNQNRHDVPMGKSQSDTRYDSDWSTSKTLLNRHTMLPESSALFCFCAQIENEKLDEKKILLTYRFPTTL